MTQRQINERKPFNPQDRYSTDVEMEKGEWKSTIGFVVGLGMIFFLLYVYRTWAIQDYNETFAVFIEKSRNGKQFKFTTVDGDEIEAFSKFRGQLNIGDTVWIKYSTFDETVIEVIDTDYKK